MSYHGLWSQQEAGKKQIIFHVDELYQVLEKSVKVMVAGLGTVGDKGRAKVSLQVGGNSDLAHVIIEL